MKRINAAAAILLFLASFLYGQDAVRLKDIAHVQGIRENQLTGFGLVTGLSGKGDSDSSILLKTVVSNLLSSFDVSVSPDEVKSKNAAVVMVTADIPPFIRPGDRVSVTLSSLGDAKSLAGGVLLQTPLKGANGNVYAVAQGNIAHTELGDSVQTVGGVPGGAIVERQVVSQMEDRNYISIILRHSDFTTADSVSAAVREAFPETEVSAEDASMIRIAVPDEYKDNTVAFIARVENLSVTPDAAAKVVINPRTGVVVMGRDVKIGKVAVSYKGDRISVGAGFGFGGQNETTEQFVLGEYTTVDELIELMQEIGLKTDVIIEVLKTIEQAGALYGRLEIM